jgi:AcrR family transcriptional regulator
VTAWRPDRRCTCYTRRVRTRQKYSRFGGTSGYGLTEISLNPVSRSTAPQTPKSRLSHRDTGPEDRSNQKRRTRQALIDAALALRDEGRNPTFAEVAERALVSRATAYRYFSSFDALISETAADRDMTPLERFWQPGDNPVDGIGLAANALNRLREEALNEMADWRRSWPLDKLGRHRPGQSKQSTRNDMTACIRGARRKSLCTAIQTSRTNSAPTCGKRTRRGSALPMKSGRTAIPTPVAAAAACTARSLLRKTIDAPPA